MPNKEIKCPKHDTGGGPCYCEPQTPPASTNIHYVSNWDESCDNCEYQEEGGHYCNLHGITVTDMNIKCREDFEAK